MAVENDKTRTEKLFSYENIGTIYVFFFLFFYAWLAKSAGGDAIATVDLHYMFTSALSFVPRCLILHITPATVFLLL